MKLFAVDDADRNQRYLGITDEVPSYEKQDFQEYVWLSINYVNGINWCQKNGRKYTVINAGLTDKNFDDFQEYVDKTSKKIGSFFTMASSLNSSRI